MSNYGIRYLQKESGKGKYNLLVEAFLDSGQSILVTKIFDDQSYVPKTDELDEVGLLLKLASENLKPKTLKKLIDFIGKQKKLSKSQIEILFALIKNNE